MNPKHQHLTAINTPWGCFEWTIMPQGACNSPSTWQQRIIWALRHLMGEIAFAYVDDIIVFGATTIAEHEKNVHAVLQALRKEGLFVNPAKSEFITEEVEILGHQITKNGIYADYQKIKKNPSMAYTTNQETYSMFHGICKLHQKVHPKYCTACHQTDEINA